MAKENDSETVKAPSHNNGLWISHPPVLFKANCPQRGCKQPLSVDVYAHALSNHPPPIPSSTASCLLTTGYTFSHPLLPQSFVTFHIFKMRKPFKTWYVSKRNILCIQFFTKEFNLFFYFFIWKFFSKAVKLIKFNQITWKNIQIFKWMFYSLNFSNV